MNNLLRDRWYLPALLKAIYQARREIRARIFLIDPQGGIKDPVLQILKALAERKKKGVEVSILTDGIFRNKPSAKRLIKTCSRLGLSIDWDGTNTILHEKTVLIDVRHLFIISHKSLYFVL